MVSLICQQLFFYQALFLQAKEEQIASLETENAILHIKTAQVGAQYYSDSEQN